MWLIIGRCGDRVEGLLTGELVLRPGALGAVDEDGNVLLGAEHGPFTKHDRREMVRFLRAVVNGLEGGKRPRRLKR